MSEMQNLTFDATALTYFIFVVVVVFDFLNQLLVETFIDNILVNVTIVELLLVAFTFFSMYDESYFTLNPKSGTFLLTPFKEKLQYVQKTSIWCGHLALLNLFVICTITTPDNGFIIYPWNFIITALTPCLYIGTVNALFDESIRQNHPKINKIDIQNANYHHSILYIEVALYISWLFVVTHQICIVASYLGFVK